MKNWLESISNEYTWREKENIDPADAEAALVNWTQADCRDAVIAQKPAIVAVWWPTR